MSCVLVRRESTRPVVHVTLNKPSVHNAFDAALIVELTAAFADLSSDPEKDRIIVLSGAGRSFCAGADLQWMQACCDYTEAENAADAQKLMRLFKTINETPRFVIGRIQGAAIGGGAGLSACCDVVVAHERAVFAFSEVLLGIIPAVISPFVLSKIGASQARRYFLSGERFAAARAQTMGLVHEVAPGVPGDTAALDALVEKQIAVGLKAGPRAVGAAKSLIAEVAGKNVDDRLFEYTTTTIAALRVGEEAQAGFQAFLDKTPAPWTFP